MIAVNTRECTSIYSDGKTDLISDGGLSHKNCHPETDRRTFLSPLIVHGFKMRKLLLLLLLPAIFWGCGQKSIDPYAPTSRPVGEWKAEAGGAGGFTNYDSFKNFQYNFDVPTGNQKVNIRLTSSDINVQYALFNSYNLPVDIQGKGQDLNKQYTLDAGTYRIVVTAERQAVGRFSLSFEGISNGATLISSTVLQSSLDWGPLGGGGNELTFKNRLYVIDVTEDGTSFDAELESPDTDARIWVYDISSRQFTTTRQGRYSYEIRAVDKGKYVMMAATTVRGNTGSYNLRITGKVANLTKVESQSMVATGQWSASSKVDQSKLAYDEYTLQLTDDEVNFLDLEITSTDTFVELYLQAVGGATIPTTSQTSAQNKSYKIVQSTLPKGLYKITARTSTSAKGKYGSYTLSLFGSFSDFKKI